jgi:hypothetical protein
MHELAARQTDLVTSLVDNTAFPGPPAESWPRFTVDRMNDGSMSDGDSCDWRLAY